MLRVEKRPAPACSPSIVFPAEAPGSGFAGAAFTHVGARVTFAVRLARFALETPALLRFVALVHFLDVSGVQPAEAAGVESALAGSLFDGLLASFQKEKHA